MFCVELDLDGVAGANDLENFNHSFLTTFQVERKIIPKSYVPQDDVKQILVRDFLKNLEFSAAKYYFRSVSCTVVSHT